MRRGGPRSAVAAVWAIAFAAGVAPAQAPGNTGNTGVVRVRVFSDSVAVVGATVRSAAVAGRTNERGEFALSLPAGDRLIVVARLGLRPDSQRVAVRAGMDTTIVVLLVARTAEVERVVVTSTRTDRRIEDVPLRVEVLGREEVEEKLLMTPGDISMMMNETGGLRVQTTSPSLGAANVRVQGLRGRYTLLLSDGLPLHGGQIGTLGLLQIPPMDLAQVEVIKGAASALYGASAMGGVINLVSRRPGEASEHQLLLNQTTRGGSDAVAWSSHQLTDAWGYTLLGSAHRQARTDVDGDGWADIAGYRRAVVRPRVFWRGRAGRNALFTAGSTLEERDGGTLAARLAPDGAPFVEGLDTRRADAAIVLRLPFQSGVASTRGSASSQHHVHRFGAVRERDRHDTWFAETAVTLARGAGTAVVGAALEYNVFRSRDVARFDHAHRIPSAFAQLDVDAAAWLAASASARMDAHSEFGSSVNPRLSLLVRAPHQWTIRLSGGTGVFTPTPFLEDVEATGLSPLRALLSLVVERGRSLSLDLGGRAGPVELNVTGFASQVTSPLAAREPGGAPGELELVNAALPTRTAGADGLARLRLSDVVTTMTYTYVRSTEEDPATATRRAVPLVPRHAAGLVSVWEYEGVQRVGVELYYTGRQALDRNPYLTASRPYVIVGAIAERRIGRVRVFVNLENIGDERMTKHHPLVRPARGEGGRWTTDAWGPLDGRTINAGVRLDLVSRPGVRP